MKRRQVGAVSALWRYPVKSMLGEQLRELMVTERGAVGDRAWALTEASSGRVVTAKKWPNMLKLRAAYEAPPETGRLTPVKIELPDGRVIDAEDNSAGEILSSLLGRAVRLERAQLGEFAIAEIDPATVFGDVPPEMLRSNVLPEYIRAHLRGDRDDDLAQLVKARLRAKGVRLESYSDPGKAIDNVPLEELVPELTSGVLPDTLGLPKGTFFDSAVLHILASGTLAYMNRLCESDSRFDPRRFRPNVFIDTGSDNDRFVEDEWIRGVLEIGDSLKIVGMRSALRCVMTTHAQTDLPRDLKIFRTVAEHHHATAGLFVSVGAPGKVRVGDPVSLAPGS